mmetsp:Transcript_16937/g.48100  ORF Transcript_16937/g.48100 Transcript_16937/m.48100 type:complete len:215 (-) Transcript_16937:314-958(-)
MPSIGRWNAPAQVGPLGHQLQGATARLLAHVALLVFAVSQVDPSVVAVFRSLRSLLGAGRTRRALGRREPVPGYRCDQVTQAPEGHFARCLVPSSFQEDPAGGAGTGARAKRKLRDLFFLPERVSQGHRGKRVHDTLGSEPWAGGRHTYTRERELDRAGASPLVLVRPRSLSATQRRIIDMQKVALSELRLVPNTRHGRQGMARPLHRASALGL